MNQLKEPRHSNTYAKTATHKWTSLRLATGIAFITLSYASSSQAIENKVQLEDVSIKGEATKFGMNSLARTKNSLDGRIVMRTSFKDRALEDLPKGFDSKELAKNPQTK